MREKERYILIAKSALFKKKSQNPKKNIKLSFAVRKMS